MNLEKRFLVIASLFLSILFLLNLTTTIFADASKEYVILNDSNFEINSYSEYTPYIEGSLRKSPGYEGLKIKPFSFDSKVFKLNYFDRLPFGNDYVVSFVLFLKDSLNNEQESLLDKRLTYYLKSKKNISNLLLKDNLSLDNYVAFDNLIPNVVFNRTYYKDYSWLSLAYSDYFKVDLTTVDFSEVSQIYIYVVRYNYVSNNYAYGSKKDNDYPENIFNYNNSDTDKVKLTLVSNKSEYKADEIFSENQDLENEKSTVETNSENGIFKKDSISDRLNSKAMSNTNKFKENGFYRLQANNDGIYEPKFKLLGFNSDSNLGVIKCNNPLESIISIDNFKQELKNIIDEEYSKSKDNTTIDGFCEFIYGKNIIENDILTFKANYNITYGDFPSYIYLYKYDKDKLEVPFNFKDDSGTNLAEENKPLNPFDESKYENYDVETLVFLPEIFDLSFNNSLSYKDYDSETDDVVDNNGDPIKHNGALVVNKNKIVMLPQKYGSYLDINLSVSNFDSFDIDSMNNNSEINKEPVYVYVGKLDDPNTITNLKSFYDFKNISNLNIPIINDKRSITINDSLSSNNLQLFKLEYGSDLNFTLKLESEDTEFIVFIFQYKDFAGRRNLLDYGGLLFDESKRTVDSMFVTPNYQTDFLLFTKNCTGDDYCKLNTLKLNTSILEFFCPSCKIPFLGINKDLFNLIFNNDVDSKINIVLQPDSRLNDFVDNLNSDNLYGNGVELVDWFTSIESDLRDNMPEINFSIDDGSNKPENKTQKILEETKVEDNNISKEAYFNKLLDNFEISPIIREELRKEYESIVKLGDSYDKEFNRIIDDDIPAIYDMTDEEKAQFWAIMAQESGGVIDLDQLKSINDDKANELGIAQVTPQWYDYNNNPKAKDQYLKTDNKFKFEYIFNEKNLYTLRCTTVGLANIDVSNSACISGYENCMTEKGYYQLLDAIKENKNKYASVVWGAAFYYRLAQELSAKSLGAKKPFEKEHRVKFDLANSIDQFFATAYLYHNSDVLIFKDGIKNYDIEFDSYKPEILESAKQKLKYYLYYKLKHFEGGSSSDSSNNIESEKLDLQNLIEKKAMVYFDNKTCYDVEIDSVKNDCTGFLYNVLKDVYSDSKYDSNIKKLKEIVKDPYTGTYGPTIAAYLNGKYTVLNEVDTDYSNLKKGDFLFFNGFFHAGIYLGEKSVSYGDKTVNYENAIIHSGYDYDGKSNVEAVGCELKFTSNSVVNIDELDVIRNRLKNIKPDYPHDVFVLRLNDPITFSESNFDKVHADFLENGSDCVITLKNVLNEINLDSSNNESEELQEETVESVTLCPSGYIFIKGDTRYNTDDFCVMKYEAKKDSNNKPISVYNNLPWVNISQTDAKAACETVTFGNKKGHLITNDEWMTIAQKIVNLNTNWTGGSKGTGDVFSGNSESEIFEAYNNDISGANYGPDETTIANRRILAINNDNYIWDFSGNAAELVDKKTSCDFFDNFIFYGANSDDGSHIRFFDPDRSQFFKSLKSDYINKDVFLESKFPTSNGGIGYLELPDNKNGNCFWVRGGFMSVGLLHLELIPENKTSEFYVGFRCTVPANNS